MKFATWRRPLLLEVLYDLVIKKGWGLCYESFVRRRLYRSCLNLVITCLLGRGFLASNEQTPPTVEYLVRRTCSYWLPLAVVVVFRITVAMEESLTVWTIVSVLRLGTLRLVLVPRVIKRI